MKLDDIRGKHINVEELPDEIHMQLTIHKLANELITINTQLDNISQMEDPQEMKNEILRIRLHITKLIATMIHLFEWIDFGDIIDKVNFRKYLEEYLLLYEKCDDKTYMIDSKGTLKIEKGE